MDRIYKITNFIKISKNGIFNGREQVFSAEGSEDLNVFLKNAYKKLEISYPKFHKMDSLCKLGIIATEFLFKNRKINADTALVFSNSASSLETDKLHQDLMSSGVSPSVFVYTLPNIVSGEISIKYKLQSENAFFISKSFDAGLIQGYSKIILDLNKAGEVVCGWIELKNGRYDVFLCLISNEGEIPFSKENLEELYRFKNE